MAEQLAEAFVVSDPAAATGDESKMSAEALATFAIIASACVRLTAT